MDIGLQRHCFWFCRVSIAKRIAPKEEITFGGLCKLIRPTLSNSKSFKVSNDFIRNAIIVCTNYL